PRPRINWTSLSNALYDEVLGSLLLEVTGPIAARAKKSAHAANALIEDITDAIVNYTTAFVTYEEAYRCVLVAQADSFRKKSVMRVALRRWSMEAVVRQQDRALQQQYIDDLDELIDSEYASGDHHPRALAGSADTMWQASRSPQRAPKAPASTSVPADFWESCHLGRDGFDAMCRALRRFGGPAFNVAVDVSGTRGSSVLASWLWWQVDMSSLSTLDACEPPCRVSSYTSGAQHLLFRELGRAHTLDGGERAASRLSAQIVLLASELIGPDDISGDVGGSPLGAGIAASVKEVLDRARARPGGNAVLPILLLFWCSDPRTGKSVRKLVERVASASGIPSFVAVNTLALTIDTSKQQFADGLKWVFKHLVLARRESLIRVPKAYESIGMALLQSLRRIYSCVDSLVGHQ
ncbi:hypothetical protein GGH91_005795, partial [Coemansia sp. RSA 2671]